MSGGYAICTQSVPMPCLLLVTVFFFWHEGHQSSPPKPTGQDSDLTPHEAQGPPEYQLSLQDVTATLQDNLSGDADSHPRWQHQQHG